MTSKVAWESWGEAAFARAAGEDKPVLLSISAVWCHWCHVMDRTTYADERVAEAIARNFVAVRVDNDERPDVNARYNMGGWPTTAFLTPDGAILTGATYLPPETMLRALDEITAFYQRERSQIEERSLQMRNARTAYTLAASEDLQPELLDRYTASVLADYDEEFGGFGESPKFPQPELLDFLLTRWRGANDVRAYDAVAATMRAMSGGGMYDPVEGGYFRYSTTRDWTVPHFEKMAEDHGGLLRVLARLELWAPAQQWRDDLARTLRYVRGVLRDPQTGLFAGSQDADEAYYALNAAERAKRDAPFIDRRSYSNWTAHLAGAFAWCATALDDPALMSEAEQTLDTLHRRALDEHGFLLHVLAPGEAARVGGLLTDQAAYLRALLDLYELGGETRFLERARSLAGLVIERFGGPDGGFQDRLAVENLGRLAQPDRPLPENGILAESLLRLATILHDDDLFRAAEQTLRVYGRTFERAGAFAATYARALMRRLAPALGVRLTGARAQRLRFVQAAARLPSPFATLEHEAQGTPAAALCLGTACAAPVGDGAQLAQAYLGLVRNMASPAGVEQNGGPHA